MTSLCVSKAARAAALLVTLATACDDTPAGGGGPGAPTGLAIIHSDFMASASVSLVDPATRTVVRQDCINSGSKAPQLSTALSADLVVPSRPQPGNALVIIDREHATLTWLDPKECQVLRQLNVGDGFMANPQDVIAVSATKAYVTRYGADPGDPARGSDLLIIDPGAARILGRVDLRGQATAAPAGSTATIEPRPGPGVLYRDRVYVLLNNLSGDFKTAGGGRVVVIDPATDAVVDKIDLPELTNCAALETVEGAAALVASCAGVFGDGGRRLAASGAAWIDLGSTPATVTRVSAEGFERALSPFDVGALGKDRAWTIVLGEFGMGGPPDRLWAFDFMGGAPKMVFEATAAFTLSGLAIDGKRQKVFAADAGDGKHRLLVFDASKTPLALDTEIGATTATGLPPRSARFY